MGYLRGLEMTQVGSFEARKIYLMKDKTKKN